MSAKKPQIVSSSSRVGRKEKLYTNESGTWASLKGSDDFRNMNSAKVWELVRLALSEFLGTAILVGLGCGSVVSGIPGSESHGSHLNTVLSFSFALSVSLTVFSHISGSHVNPAVSLSAVIFGHLSLPRFLVYAASQCAGACLGIAMIKVISPDGCAEESFCVTVPSSEVGAMRAALAEAVLTGILIWVCDAAWDHRCQDKHDSMPIKFALTIAAIALPGAKFSGASLNPARSFAPALFSGNWTNHWVYWIGPLGGSLGASAIYRVFFFEALPPAKGPTSETLAPEEETLPL